MSLEEEIALGNERLPDGACGRSRKADLYIRGRELLLKKWKCLQCPTDRSPQFGGPRNTFVDADQGRCTIQLVVATLEKRTKWTTEHTGAVSAGFDGDTGIAAVIIVDGAVDPEVFVHNLQPGSAVHVIEGIALANCRIDKLPCLVSADSVCQEDCLTEATELPRVRSSAPEVQLLRARRHDILAYPPTPVSGFEPSGQVSDWVARIVVP